MCHLNTKPDKNRFSDIIPYDSSRVCLKRDQLDENEEMEDEEDEVPSDYINANFIDGFQRENAFIASQGIARLCACVCVCGYLPACPPD